MRNDYIEWSQATETHTQENWYFMVLLRAREKNEKEKCLFDEIRKCLKTIFNGEKWQQIKRKKRIEEEAKIETAE